MARVIDINIKNLSSAELAKGIRDMSENEWIDLYVIELESRIVELEAEADLPELIDETKVIGWLNKQCADDTAFGRTARELREFMFYLMSLNAKQQDRIAELESPWHDLRKDPEDLPPDNRLVEVWLENPYSKRRLPLVGCYAREKQLEAEDSEEFGEYDEDTDCYWCPAGWYESVANDYCDYGYVHCNSDHIIGWRYITPPETEQ